MEKEEDKSLQTIEAVGRFNEATPDGARYQGQEAVRAFWEKFFRSSHDALFETEEMFAAGDRCAVLWVYRKMRDGQPWHLRGVDVFRVRDGKVAEKLAYVKG